MDLQQEVTLLVLQPSQSRKSSRPEMGTACDYCLRGAGYVSALFLTYLLLTPDPFWFSATLKMIVKLLFSGYAIHFLTYIFLTSVALFVCSRTRLLSEFMCLQCLVAHAIMTELAQIWIPKRSWDLTDMFCNFAGILIVACFYRRYRVGNRLSFGS